MSMPPLLAPQFFIGHESPKDAWANKLRKTEKGTDHEHSKGRVQGDESPGGGRSKPHSYTGYPKSIKLISMGIGEYYS